MCWLLPCVSSCAAAVLSSLLSQVADDFLALSEELPLLSNDAAGDDECLVYVAVSRPVLALVLSRDLTRLLQGRMTGPLDGMRVVLEVGWSLAAGL